jgi:outer membrane immunogenic protein
MKKHLLGGVALIALGVGGSAMAADMPVKAPLVAPAPVFTWTGCYLGVHAGGAWGRKDFFDPSGEENFAPPGQPVTVKMRGAIGGGQVGCNYQLEQLAPNWVFGAEIDASYTDLRGNAVDPFFENKNFGARTHWLASATVRVGYAVDRTMVYVKGGAAWARDRYDFAGSGGIEGLFIVNTSATVRETRPGWTIGVGIEHAFWDNWSVKLEYDHYGFSTRTVTFVDPEGGFLPFFTGVTDADVRQRIDVVKVGINYRFGGPISVRY